MDKIAQAVEKTRNGEVVAFPTETVYGLGANALDPNAVKKIFELKNRPANNPLVVHIASIYDLEKIAEKPSPKIQKLIHNFWPGGLSIVFKKKGIVPDITTGGLDTVVIRMPKNEIARKLIETSGLPIAAPSANISGKPSPTHHNHVKRYFGDKVFVIEGGSCEIGLESTVIAEIKGKIHLLRPGAVTVEDIEEVLGEKVIIEQKADDKPLSPGQMYRHYSPKGKLVLVTEEELEKFIEILSCGREGGSSKGEVVEIKSAGLEKRRKMQKGIIIRNEDDESDGTPAEKFLLEKLAQTAGVPSLDPNKVALITFTKYKSLAQKLNIEFYDLGQTIESASKLAFDALNFFDNENTEVIFCQKFDKKGLGLALMNRLEKAAHN